MTLRRGLTAFLGAVLLLVSPVASRAQEMTDRPLPGSQQLFIEPLSLPSADSGKARLDIAYRIASPFFVPVRVTEPFGSGKFRQRGEFHLTLFDSTRTSVAQRTRLVDIASDSAEADPKKWIGGVFTFSVPPGPYTALAELVDNESRRRLLDGSVRIRTEEFTAGSGAISTPIFTLPVDSSSDNRRLPIQNFAGGILFGSTGGLYLAFAGPDSAGLPVELRYEFAVRLEEGDDRAGVILSDTLTGLAATDDLPLVPAADADSAWYSLGLSAQRHVSGIYVKLPLERLPLRPYLLRATVRQGGWERSLTHRFRLVWPDMPVSLRDVEFALEALRYITSRRVIDSLSSGTLEETMSNLEAFWKERDRTPATAFNEVMAEYYRRVDYAMRNFGTLRNPDGFASDRGRIYVVYGPPTQTSRALDPREGFRETWSYGHLKKTFTFVDRTKTGNYVLLSTENP